jgi:hypothetical protein
VIRVVTVEKKIVFSDSAQLIASRNLNFKN